MMFNLKDIDLNKPIVSFGDGPASFNYELKDKTIVVSLDPIYKFSRIEIEERIAETKQIILDQVEKNKNNYLWNKITNIKHLENIRMDAMNKFLFDFEIGIIEKRYIAHELPFKTNFPSKYFNLALSSHFLLLYSQLGYNFHIKSINEMLRVAKEVRIFPIVDLNNKKSKLLYSIINHYKNNFKVIVVKSGYEFQKESNEMLIIKDIN